MNGMRHCVFVLALASALVAGIPLLTVDGVSTAIGLNHLCILAASDAAVGGAALCTGNPEFGKTAPPEDVVFVQLAAGLYFTCGLSVDQRVHCWGQISNTPEDGPTSIWSHRLLAFTNTARDFAGPQHSNE